MKRFAVIALLILFAISSFGQTINSLREQIRRAEEEIRINTKLLEKNRKDQKVTQQQLQLIHNRIDNRRKILSSLESQIGLIGKDIDTKNKDITKLESELSVLEKEYARMVYEGYKNYKTNNFTLFIIASEDFNQASQRIAYIRRYSAACQAKAALIDTVSHNLTVQIEELNARKQELDRSKKQRSSEIAALGKDETTYKSSAEELRKSESRLSSSVKARQAQIAKAQQQIARLVAAEAKKSASTPKTAEQTKADEIITGKFDQNKGRLPYPVANAVIIDQYGIHEHPTQKGTKVNNKGINLATPKGADVKCVFEGVVTNVFFFQGLNNSIMVNHGSYYTVYSNLSNVSVKKGDKVALNQTLGSVSSSDNDADHMLHFEIWKAVSKQDPVSLDPSLWLRR